LARASEGLSTTLWRLLRCSSRLGRLDFADVGRQCNADSFEDSADVAGRRRAQDELLSVLFGFDLLQTVEFAEKRAPLGLQARADKMAFQELAQHECEE